MEQAEINTKARNALETYEVVDDTCRICYVDGYEDGYNQALADNPILQDIADGKAIIVDRAWLAEYKEHIIDMTAKYVYNNQPAIGDSMRKYVDGVIKAMKE